MNDILKILTRDSNVNDQDQPLTWYYTYLCIVLLQVQKMQTTLIEQVLCMHDANNTLNSMRELKIGHFSWNF